MRMEAHPPPFFLPLAVVACSSSPGRGFPVGFVQNYLNRTPEEQATDEAEWAEIDAVIAVPADSATATGGRGG